MRLEWCAHVYRAVGTLFYRVEIELWFRIWNWKINSCSPPNERSIKRICVSHCSVKILRFVSKTRYGFPVWCIFLCYSFLLFLPLPFIYLLVKRLYPVSVATEVKRIKPSFLPSLYILAYALDKRFHFMSTWANIILGMENGCAMSRKSAP